jgi:hypothetical protein
VKENYSAILIISAHKRLILKETIKVAPTVIFNNHSSLIYINSSGKNPLAQC